MNTEKAFKIDCSKVATFTTEPHMFIGHFTCCFSSDSLWRGEHPRLSWRSDVVNKGSDFVDGISCMPPRFMQNFRIYFASQQSLTKFLVHCCLQPLGLEEPHILFRCFRLFPLTVEADSCWLGNDFGCFQSFFFKVCTFGRKTFTSIFNKKSCLSLMRNGASPPEWHWGLTPAKAR